MNHRSRHQHRSHRVPSSITRRVSFFGQPFTRAGRNASSIAATTTRSASTVGRSIRAIRSIAPAADRSAKPPSSAPENLLRRLPSTNHWTETIRHAARSGDMSLDSMTILNSLVSGKMFWTYTIAFAISSPLLKKPHSTLTSRTNLGVSFFTEIF
jgi:hypothetical protein